MMKNYLRLYTFLIAIMLVTGSNLVAQKILFLGRGTLGQYVSDKALYDKIVSWGYEVDFITALPASASEYNGYIGLVISESISSSTANSFSTNGYPIPCINFEGWELLSDRWGGWVKDGSGTTPKTDWNQKGDAGVDGQYIIIKDNNHYITQIFNVNDEIQWTTSEDATILSNTNPVSFMEVDVPYSGKLAQAKSYIEDGFYTMVTVDSMESIPNRIFVWGIVDAAFELIDAGIGQTSATDEFFQIISRAVDWAFLGKNLEVGVKDLTNDFAIEVYPNPVVNELNIRYFDPIGNKNVKITLNTITGQELQFIGEKEALYGYNYVTTDVTSLTDGMYIVKIVAGDKVYTKKLVIDR